MQRQLPGYDASDEESTARHDIPRLEAHIHMHSEPEIRPSDAPAKKQLRGALTALGIGLGTTLVAGLATLFQSCHH